MTVRTKKAVVTAAQELIEGIGVVPDPATDALPTMEPPRAVHEQEPVENTSSVGTLSPEPDAPGLSTGSVTAKVYVAGSGTHDTQPRWGRWLEACGMRREVDYRIQKITIPSLATGQRFFLGEEVNNTGGSGAKGIVVGFRKGTTEDYVYVWPAFGNVSSSAHDQFASGDTLVGGTSLLTSGAATAAADHGILWRPDETTVLELTLSGDLLVAPAVGDTLYANNTGVVNRGAFTVLEYKDTAAGGPYLRVQRLYGNIINTDKLYLVKSAANLQIAGPADVTVTGRSIVTGAALSIRYNVDGFERDFSGMRGNFVIDAQGGSTATMEFQMQGFWLASRDAPRPSTLSFGTVPVPKRALNGSMYLMGLPLITQSIGINGGMSINTDEDGNAALGVAPSSIDDRAPNWTISARLPRYGGFEFDDKLTNQREVFAGMQIGTAEGSLITFISMRGQLSDVQMSENNGKEQVQGTMGAKRGHDNQGWNGNDELLVCHL
ncbi:MAG: hypothetical protein ACPGQD_06570 [Planctomycetota bacterium]